MGRLFFIRKWNKKGRNVTWSGTPNGILEALYRVTTDRNKIREVDIKYSGIDSIRVKIAHLMQRIMSVDGCDVMERVVESSVVNKILQNDCDGTVLVFSELNIDKQNDTYIYIDCSVDYVFRCQHNNVGYAKYVPFPQMRKKTLIGKREEMAMSFYKKCKGIFTMGQWLKTDLIENTGMPESKVHCVGGGCNISVNKIDSSRKTGNKFLFVGKDFERKNGPLVVNAFKILRQSSLTDIELYIAGPVAWPMQEPIPDGVKFLGLKSTDELSTYYNLCDVFVMPSRFEAYGIVFAEALIYGLPCIGRDAFSMSEFIHDGKNGYLLKDDSVESLAELMKKAIQNHRMIQDVKNGRENYIQEYSWNTVVNRMLNVMRKDGYNI